MGTKSNKRAALSENFLPHYFKIILLLLLLSSCPYFSSSTITASTSTQHNFRNQSDGIKSFMKEILQSPYYGEYYHIISPRNNNKDKKHKQSNNIHQDSSSTSFINDIDNELIGLAGYQSNYDSPLKQPNLHFGKAHEFSFRRFQSPKSIQSAMNYAKKKGKKRKNADHYKFKKYHGKDGRRGFVFYSKLGSPKTKKTDIRDGWVLAESKQKVIGYTTDDVIKAYLSDSLQEKWNPKTIMKCVSCMKNIDTNNTDDSSSFLDIDRDKMKRSSRKRKRNFGDNENNNIGKYYRQDLTLFSVRVVTSHTEIMKYSQDIYIDKIGKHNYSVLVNIVSPKLASSEENKSSAESDETSLSSSSSSCKRPFDSLSAYIGLEQNGNDVDIYASGIMKVNREVIPNFVIFDPSSIAGSQAGKGTLWLAAHFDELLKRKRLQEQEEKDR